MAPGATVTFGGQQLSNAGTGQGAPGDRDTVS